MARPWIFGLCLLLAACGQATPKTPFDPEQWRSADLTTRSRAEMVDSLLQLHPLRGKSRTAIVALLGDPTTTDMWPQSEMVYVLGPTRGFAIVHEWLLIELDADQKVVSYTVLSD